MEKTFESWMYAVNTIIEARTGMSSDDLPDVCYRDMFDDEASASYAARFAIRNAQD